MEVKAPQNSILNAILGNRYAQITNISDKARFLTMNGIFSVALIPLTIFGVIEMGDDIIRAVINFSIAGVCLLTLILLRTKISLKVLPIIPVTLYGAYCLFLLHNGGLYMWLAVWFFSFPLVAIFLCQMLIGVIESVVGVSIAYIMLYTPGASVFEMDPQIKFRFIAGYLFILFLTIIFECINILKDKKEVKLNIDLVFERDNLKNQIGLATSEISAICIKRQKTVSS